MAPRTLSHNEYTVAWICALPVEMAAAKAMLDEIHGPLSQHPTDHNVYTLGSLSGHNIVIACLPAGIYGTISAATVLAHMLPTFPCLRFGLLVGIGGGVPSESTDIRLGDVIVSVPTGTSGGVIQYDHGKSLHDGRFQRTGSLNRPPQLLLSTISQLRSNHILGDRPIRRIMTDTFLKRPELAEQFSRPNKDWLFKSTYDHQNNDLDCSKCDREELIIRAPRINTEPYIHHGLVASGDSVMKDARARDSIARELDIICFEMEAAGLMDQLPCLVVRGICDYCDTHKNKEWQGYAALTASSYTKILLSAVPSAYEDRDSWNHRRSAGHWVVPFRRNRQFVGRHHELDVLKNLFSDPDGPTDVAVTGLGGVGKTQIALELAYRVRSEDPTCSVYWVPCVSQGSIEQAYMSIAQEMGMQDAKPMLVKEQVKDHLSRRSSGNWLLIYDNADDRDMWINNSAALKDILPESDHGRILFTSRNYGLAVDLAAPNVIQVPEFDRETGVLFLAKSLVQKDLLDNSGAAMSLLESLTFLPLAVTQAVAYINRNQINLTDYVALLGKQESEIIDLLSQDFQDKWRYKDCQNPVAITWWISFQQIRHLNQIAADYLSFMACLHPRNIPLSLLPQTASWTKMTDAIGLLKSYSFVSGQIGDNFLNLHRLIYVATRNWMRKNKQFSQQLLKAADRLNEVFPDGDDSNRRSWREYLPHSLSVCQEGDFQSASGRYINLLERIGNCLYRDGRYKEAEKLQTLVTKACTLVHGAEHSDTLTSIANLASTYWNQGQSKESDRLFVRMMESIKRGPGPDHRETLRKVNRLAAAYRHLGRWKEPEELQLQMMEVRKKISGQALTTITNHAFTSWNKKQWKEAESLVVKVIDAWKQTLGPEDPEILTGMASLALTYRNQERWRDAEQLELQVMGARKKVLGSEHPDTLISMGNLGSIYWNEGQWKNAEILFRQLMQAQERGLGSEHPASITSMANLASTYRIRGLSMEAEKLQVHVLEMRRRILGPEHPSTLTSIASLALTYRDQSRWEEAKELQDEGLQLCLKAQGPEHPDTLIGMANLAFIYWTQKEWGEAELLFRQVMQIQKQALGLRYPSTLASISNLASAYWIQGRLEEAEELESQIAETRKQILGPQHPSSITSMVNLARTYFDQGRLDKAGELQAQVVEIYRKVLGPEHPETLNSIRDLASIW